MRFVRCKLYFFIISIILLIVFCFYKYYLSINSFYSLNIIDENTYNNIISNRKEVKDNINIYYNSTYIPYSKNDNYYLLSFFNNNGSITNKDGYILKVKEFDEDINNIIKNNEIITLIAYNDSSYKELNLKFTSLPVISILDNKTSIFDNSTSTINTYNCEYHIRGSSSQIHNKKSYKLNIKNKNYDNKKVSLLNLRYDDDYILNPLSVDNSFIREKLAYSLWNDISEYDINSRYVELFINNEYKGLYLLMEPVTLETFSANKSSDIIMTKDRNESILNKKIFTDVKEKTIIDEFEFVTKNNSFDVRLDLLRKFYSDIYSIDYDSINNVTYDYESFVNYSIFINMTLAIDNYYKNEKVLFRKINNNTYEVSKCIWDMDYSGYNESVTHFNEKMILTDELTPSFILNSEEYDAKIKNNYFEFSSKYYNYEYISKLIDKYTNIIENSGAIKRDNLKYEVESDKYYESLNIVKNFYKNRIDFLNKYYEGL